MKANLCFDIKVSCYMYVNKNDANRSLGVFESNLKSVAADALQLKSVAADAH